ncbi:MAG TPA: kelch repeat-containing protein [Terriglobia bacterium]|nr:kelch repeat-containing protein [Terriglobia bacterium]
MNHEKLTRWPNLKPGHTNSSLAAPFPVSRLALVALFLLILLSCGGAGNPPASDQLQVAVYPSAVNLDQGGTKTFTVTVTGSSNKAVNWSVREGSSGGNITSAGVYAAPAAAGTFHVIATSQADSTKTAFATIVVPAVSVTLSPPEATLRPNGTQGFTATVRGSIDTKVTWEIQEGVSGGAVTSTGLYTAPANTGFYHVTATSSADATQSATAQITVTTSSGLFSPVGDLQVPRVYHTATLLPNGKVLVAGGAKKKPLYFSGLATAEIFDPTTGLFTATSNMGSPRFAHTATLLPNGKVLVTGGEGASGLDGQMDPTPPPALDSAEIYDPATGTFMPTGKMSVARAGHTATLLPNGKVLIVGGGSNDSTALATAEIYDPATGAFVATGPLGTARAYHTATLLTDGNVLVAGGSSPTETLASAEIYNTATGSFAPTANMGTPRTGHIATRLSDGRVLVAGGYDGTTDTATAEFYDPSTGSFTPTGTMGTARERHTATLLSDGNVLIAGGSSSAEILASAEIYNPATGSFAPTGNMATPRTGHTATLLQDGRVLVAAGLNYPAGGGISFLTSAETYE